MQSHNLKRVHKNKKHQQIGRGGTRGKTSGRGTKGQNARAGHRKTSRDKRFYKKDSKNARSWKEFKYNYTIQVFCS